MRGIALILLIEAVAFIAGIIAWTFGWPWWTCLLALFVPPVIAVVGLVLMLMHDVANGSNPFQ